MNILVKSKNYTIESEYETVYLFHKSKETVIGDFYGDPADAIIDKHEQWCAMVGCGIILYYLREPFEEYEYDCKTEQWVEFHREPPNEWWIKSVVQEGRNIIKFVVEAGTKGSGVYQLDTELLKIEKVG